jgi:hypothetical protein
MNLCPRVYGADMTDPANLDYCRKIQQERGEECRRERCPHCAGEVAEDKGPVQDRPAPMQRGVF